MTAPAGAPGAEFRYVGGHPAADLVNTVDWTERGPEQERLVDYTALLRWAEGAGVLETAEVERLGRAARCRPEAAERALADARRLRHTLHALLTDVAEGRAPSPAGLERLVRLARHAGRRRALGPGPRGARRLVWRWAENAGLRRPLWPVALAAVELLTSDELERLRVCPGPDCGWVYVDHSRNGLRRWCAMDLCGGREKARRYYARNRKGA